MNNRDATEILKEEWRINAELFGKQFDEALDLAIKALEDRPTKEELLKELENCRNELCLKCGAYRESHLGACDDCRYNFEHMKKWEAEDDSDS